MRRAARMARLIGPVLAIGLSSSRAVAEERPRAGDVRVCPLVLHHAVRPAHMEWSWWLGGGAGSERSSGRGKLAGVVSAGADASWQVATFPLFRYGGPAEVRWGTWASALTDLHGARGEGGGELVFGQTEHAQFGTYALRLGGGAGDDALGRGAHWTATIAGGVWLVEARHFFYDACSAPPRPREVGRGAGLRLFATVRATPGEARRSVLLFGIELDPSFLLPPHAIEKWIGAEPARGRDGR